MTRSQNRLFCLAALAAALPSLNATALAQYELGTGSQLNAEMSMRRNPDGTFNKANTGNALDANTLVGSNGFNWGRSASAFAGTTNYDFAARNDVITGNVVAGRGFQGSVGYRARFDFMGRLGTNDLFEFRADSALSNPAYTRLGTTFESLRFGQDLAMIDIQRSGTGASPNRLRQTDFGRDNVYLAQVRADRETMVNLDSISPQSIADSRIVGTAFNDEGQPFVVSASPVRGLTVEPPSGAANLAGLSIFDAARLREDANAGRGTTMIGKPFETRFETELGSSLRIKPEPGAEPIMAEAPSDYEKILEQVAERYAKAENVEFTDQPELQKKVEEKYNELRNQLTGDLPAPLEGESIDKPKDQPSETNRLMPGLDAEGNLRSPSTTPPNESGTPDGITELFPPAGGPPKDDKDDKNGELKHPQLNLDQFAEALKHGQHLDTLSPEDESRFAELMGTAEEWLRSGQYFLAERRFERALRFIPGHPLATVGIAHSQIGSGLYLSAAATLRTLLARQPELIDVTYGPNVLPDRERLLENVATIKQRLQGVRDLDSYAFLLAYLGHQLGDRALVEQGLNTLDALSPDDSLAKLLRRIWLEGEKVEAPALPADPGK